MTRPTATPAQLRERFLALVGADTPRARGLLDGIDGAPPEPPDGTPAHAEYLDGYCAALETRRAALRAQEVSA